MHKFLGAVGFSNIRKRDLEIILEEIINQPEVMRMTKDSAGNEFAEFSKTFGNGIGIVVRGSYDEFDNFKMNYYLTPKPFNSSSTYFSDTSPDHGSEHAIFRFLSHQV